MRKETVHDIVPQPAAHRPCVLRAPGTHGAIRTGPPGRDQPPAPARRGPGRRGDRPVAASASTPGSTLRVEADTSFSTFNPFLAFFDSELDILGDIYPSLTRSTRRATRSPYLAESWTTSTDHLTWTFKIRKG